MRDTATNSDAYRQFKTMEQIKVVTSYLLNLTKSNKEAFILGVLINSDVSLNTICRFIDYNLSDKVTNKELAQKIVELLIETDAIDTSRHPSNHNPGFKLENPKFPKIL